MNTCPLPCECQQNVTVDNKPPVIGTGRPITNSVIQTVNVQSPRGGLWEWAMVALLGVAVISVLIGGTFAVVKSSFKGYTTFVQSTLKDLDTPTVVTNTQTITNTVLVPYKTGTVEPLYVPTKKVTVSNIKWRALGATDGDVIHVKYQLENKGTDEINGVELIVKLSGTNVASVIEYPVVDYHINSKTPLLPTSVRSSELAIPFDYTMSITDVSIGVNGVKIRN